MKEFGGIEAFAAHLAGMVIAEHVAIKKTLKKSAKIIEKRAKEKIGTYQPEASPFVAWQPLADSTLYGGVDENGRRFPGKIKLGYATETEHNPLLRSGELRDSISHQLSPDGLEAQIGSNSDIAVWQELGTSKIPPRSFLGGAMAEKLPEIKTLIEATLIGVVAGDAALVGKEVFEGAIKIEG